MICPTESDQFLMPWKSGEKCQAHCCNCESSKFKPRVEKKKTKRDAKIETKFNEVNPMFANYKAKTVQTNPEQKVKPFKCYLTINNNQ